MLAGERFKAWIDGLAVAWGDRLKGWMASWVEWGLTKLMESLEPEAIDIIRPVLNPIVEHPLTPQFIKDLIIKLLAGKKPLPLLLIIPIAILLFIPTITSIFQPLGNLLRYVQERVFHSWRLDPISVITAWRRDPANYEKYFDDLIEQGWTPERIEALKFLTLFYPSPRDLVGFLAHEVYEDTIASRYGLDAEIDEVLLHLDKFEKAGMKEPQVREFWRDHWEHASWMQVVEMLHRGHLTEGDITSPTTKAGWETRDAEGTKLMYDWFRLVEIPPFWRDKLTASSWNVPTRVDVRRWWDMRTISEDELRNIYHRQGYHGTDLDNYVNWTKVYTDFPMMMSRFTNGWITEEDIRVWLRGLQIPEDRINQFIQEKTKPEKTTRVIKEKDITKTDIIKGVKQGVITRGEGIELLVDMGYDEDESDYILTIGIPPDEEDKVVKERELTKTDIIKGLKAEVITEAEARTRLIELRYSGVDADFLLDIFKATIKPPTEPREREASKADIVKAVKKGLITPEEAYLMLQDIGFTPEASMFILEVQAETSPFSPINFTEFKDLTTKYRIAAGREEAPMPEELKQAAAEVVRVTGEVEALDKSIEEEQKRLLELEPLPEEATARKTELQVTRNRALAELSRVKSEYDRLVAEWKHGLP
uniref:Uncharacterized protein n=1 Tax=viral metagenome TaxID=1070528 RepID=A0A6M3XW88_9ZZZZ